MSALRSTWHPKGRQMEVPTPGRNKKRGLFAAVSLRTGDFLQEATPEGNLALIHCEVVRKTCAAGKGQPAVTDENQLPMAA